MRLGMKMSSPQSLPLVVQFWVISLSGEPAPAPGRKVLGAELGEAEGMLLKSLSNYQIGSPLPSSAMCWSASEKVL